jgi:genome maintenance exonuclease 1
MKFNHELVEALSLPRVEIDGRRHYQSKTGECFPSITTFLSQVIDKSGLNEWREKVGEEEANRATNRGARRGTALHDTTEQYVLNNPEYNKGIMPSTTVLFNQIKPVLDSRLQTIVGIELPLISSYLKLAGTCDLIAVFDGKLSIIDYKTTNWAKDMSMLESYFLQETAYAIMFEECYGTPITQLVTISAGDSEPAAQVVVQHRDTWAPKLISLLDDFYANGGLH